MKQTVLLFLVFFSGLSSAEIVNAICKEPSGRIYGQPGGKNNDKLIDEADGIRDGIISIKWETNNDVAEIQIQSPYSKGPEITDGYNIFNTDDQYSFIVLYPGAVWLYSLFLESKSLLITQHTNGVGFNRGGAISKSMLASCEIVKGVGFKP